MTGGKVEVSWQDHVSRDYLRRGFSVVIDRQSVSVSIVRAICDLSRKINCSTLVTDEQNTLSLCPAEAPANLVTVRITCFSLW
jgi:hypothetical protein